MHRCLAVAVVSGFALSACTVRPGQPVPGPQGDPGEPGAAGPRGPQGPAGVWDGGLLGVSGGGTGAASADTALSNLGAQKRVTASCDGGAIAAILDDGTVECARKRRFVAPDPLPTTPTDGDEVDYLADPLYGVAWRLRYDAAAVSADGGATPYKWQVVGGSDLYGEAAGSIGVSASAYDAGAGPLVTVPLDGEYLQTLGFSGGGWVDVGKGFNLYMSTASAGSPAVDSDAAELQVSLGSATVAGSAIFVTGSGLRSARRTLSRGWLEAQYRADNNTAFLPTAKLRWLRVRPVRVR